MNEILKNILSSERVYDQSKEIPTTNIIADGLNKSGRKTKRKKLAQIFDRNTD